MLVPQNRLEAASQAHAVPVFYRLNDTFAGIQQPNASLLFVLPRVTTRYLLAHIPKSSSEVHCLWSSPTVFHHWEYRKGGNLWQVYHLEYVIKRNKLRTHTV